MRSNSSLGKLVSLGDIARKVRELGDVTIYYKVSLFKNAKCATVAGVFRDVVALDNMFVLHKGQLNSLLAVLGHKCGSCRIVKRNGKIDCSASSVPAVVRYTGCKSCEIQTHSATDDEHGVKIGCK